MRSFYSVANSCVMVALIIVSVSSVLLPALALEFELAPNIRHAKGTSYSLNWSGYAVTGSAGSVTDVKGSWIVPAVVCSSKSQYSSFWVGIDGFNSNTVEQIGTDSDCSGGSPKYYAWYEMYPAYPVNLNLVIYAGDVVSAEVQYLGSNQFTLTIVTPRGSFSTTQTLSGAQRSSAEWIAEAPSIGGSIVSLANFGTAYFGFQYTAVSSTNFATVGGVTGAIGSFGPAVQQIVMVTRSGRIKAQPTALTASGTSFTVNWVRSGP